MSIEENLFFTVISILLLINLLLNVQQTVRKLDNDYFMHKTDFNKRFFICRGDNP